MDLMVAVVIAVFGGGVALLLLWLSEKVVNPKIESPVDPILGRKDKAAIHDIDTSFIPMPDHLRTNKEVVTWLTQDLPKLTLGLTRSR